MILERARTFRLVDKGGAGLACDERPLVMKFEISPLEGVGDVKFGLFREDVRRMAGLECSSFKRSPQATSPCDYFERLGTFFYYDSTDRLEALEFVKPARPTIYALELLGESFDAACVRLRALDSNLEVEGDGAIARQLGVSVYAPLAEDDPGAAIESVLAFAPGYYDD
jgi:hypothetical protein